METPNLDKVLERQVGGSHYMKKQIQPAKFSRINELNLFLGTAVKYIINRNKENFIEDLEKAIHYLEMEIAYQKDLSENGLIEAEFPENEAVNEKS